MLRIVIAAVLLSVTFTASGDVVFRNVRVFDGTTVLEGTDVLVRDGKIIAIGKKLPRADGVPAVDGAGKTLLPGLIDSHTHSWGDALEQALLFGVTTQLDMFTEAGFARSVRAQQATGPVTTRADLFSAGTLVTAPGGHGTQFGLPIPTISSPAEALQFVDARITEGSDWIKIVLEDGSAYGKKTPTISVETMRALIEAAHRRKKLAVVHIGTLAGARAAIGAGADGLVHLFIDQAPDAALGTFIAAHKAFVIPTLVVLQSVTGVPGGASLADDARLAPYLNAAARAGLKQAFPRRAGAPPAHYDAAEKTVRQLLASKTPVLAGSDAPNPGTAHGAALHRELELLVKAGLTPAQALTAATSAPAKAFRLSDRGRIAAGLRADLLLVDGNPTRDITATRAIAGIWKNGVAVDRASYAKAVAAAATTTASAATAPSGVLSDFESGAPSATFGTSWMPSADAMAGGKSTGQLDVTSGGANHSQKSLAITGTIDAAVPYAWFGAMWSPTDAPMTPADLSSKKELRFRAKGDGKIYRVMLFAQSKGRMPLIATFVAGPEWTEVRMPWQTFGTDGKDIMGILIGGGPAPGPFRFQVDDVELR